MSLLKTQTSTDVPEYQKSLLDWGGPRKGKQFTPSPPQVTVRIVKVATRSPHTPATRMPSSRDAGSPTGKRGLSAPLSSASSSSSLSSLTSLSSASATGDLDARLPKKQKLGNASSSSKVIHMVRDASISPNGTKDASWSPKRARTTTPGDASTITGGSDAEEDASMKPSPPKRVKNLMVESSRATTMSPSVSADTSRASSPTPLGKSLMSKTSRKADSSSKKTKRRKKRALTDLTLPPKKGSYTGLAPVMVRSASTPRSTTACESDNSIPLPQKTTQQRETWSEEDGYVRFEARTSEDVVRQLSRMGRYVTFFKNPNDPEDRAYELREYPTVDLQYPNTGAKETFLLARPRDEDHYDPTLDIENTLRTFVKDVIPTEYKDLFGQLPEDALRSIVDADDADDNEPSSMSTELSSTSLHTSVSHTPRTPASTTLTGFSSDSECASPPPPTSSRRCSPVSNGLLMTLIRARARKDGPAYTATLKEINRRLLELKKRPSEHPSGVNILRHVPHTWSTDGIPDSVVVRIIEETYQRCVGPKINQLRKYEAFSSNVYGELTPAFVSDIIEKTGLRSDSLFLDLGSGVGNVVLQVALQTGCTAFGIEEREDTAKIADDQLEQIRLRCRMWGVSMGNVELKQGDMTQSPRVDELMSKADVVLVNNYVFSEELNAALRPKFLDLKEGAIVVSLKPFAPPRSQMLTERNIDDISVILDVHPLPYHSGTVSWSNGNGTYYIHHIDREGYRLSRDKYENSRRRRGNRQFMASKTNPLRYCNFATS